MRRDAISGLLIGAMLALAGVLALDLQWARSDAIPSRTSDIDGVRVVVKPMSAAPENALWRFEVTMDTHTKPLNDDLVHAAVLTDDAGRHFSPQAWQGDPPGGHHRKGVLEFSVPGNKAKSIELQIAGIGGTASRTFRWQFD
jgi:hypothetical protein